MLFCMVTRTPDVFMLVISMQDMVLGAIKERN